MLQSFILVDAKSSLARFSGWSPAVLRKFFRGSPKILEIERNNYLSEFQHNGHFPNVLCCAVHNVHNTIEQNTNCPQINPSKNILNITVFNFSLKSSKPHRSFFSGRWNFNWSLVEFMPRDDDSIDEFHRLYSCSVYLYTTHIGIVYTTR